ncbi:hypothetical protein RDI58_024817 [Solanum bulbocastanum]|uniref:Uncharacterized protein n=1 Tax=Solanum bulbocastanum TaxID=147425 RepID=A0AAN8T1Y0_SOLBU
MVIVSQQPYSKIIQGEIAREIGLTLAGNKLWSREDQLRTRLTDQNSLILIILHDVPKALDLKETWNFKWKQPQTPVQSDIHNTFLICLCSNQWRI